MDAEAVATLSAITGLPTAEAEGFLEMGALCAGCCSAAAAQPACTHAARPDAMLHQPRLPVHSSCNISAAAAVPRTRAENRSCVRVGRGAGRAGNKLTEARVCVCRGAAGGDMDTATSLFFSMQDGGGGGLPEPGAAGAIGFDPPPWYGLVWPAVEVVPDAWLEQGLCFAENTQELVQHKNGPCGVLSAVHGVIVARALAAGEAVGPNTPVTDAALAAALAAILQQCAGEDQPVQMPTWVSDIGKDVSVEEVVATDATDAVLAKIDAFKSKGGCVLLVYAALLTRGVDQVRSTSSTVC